MGYELVQSRRSTAFNACDGKRRFLTEGAARMAASTCERMIRRNRGRKGAITIQWYTCRFCGQWHLTRTGGR